MSSKNEKLRKAGTKALGALGAASRIDENGYGCGRKAIGAMDTGLHLLSGRNQPSRSEGTGTSGRRLRRSSYSSFTQPPYGYLW